MARGKRCRVTKAAEGEKGVDDRVGTGKSTFGGTGI